MAKKAKSPTGRPSKRRPEIKAFDQGKTGVMRGGKRPKVKKPDPVKPGPKRKGGTNYRIEDALRRSGA